LILHYLYDRQRFLNPGTSHWTFYSGTFSRTICDIYPSVYTVYCMF